MTDKRDILILNENELYEINGETYSLHEIQGFINSSKTLSKRNHELLKEHRDLTDENSFLKRQNTGMKFRCRDYSQKIMELEDKLQNVTLWDLSPEAQEEAGHALARSLLGGK